jgi:hypothetical protein
LQLVFVAGGMMPDPGFPVGVVDRSVLATGHPEMVTQCDSLDES